MCIRLLMTRLFVQKCVHFSNRWNIKALYQWSFVRGIRRERWYNSQKVSNVQLNCTWNTEVQPQKSRVTCIGVHVVRCLPEKEESWHIKDKSNSNEAGFTQAMCYESHDEVAKPHAYATERYRHTHWNSSSCHWQASLSSRRLHEEYIVILQTVDTTTLYQNNCRLLKFHRYVLCISG